MVGIERPRSISDSYQTGAGMTRDQELIIKPAAAIGYLIFAVCAWPVIGAAFIDALIKAGAERKKL
jgi:hypothetical protein